MIAPFRRRMRPSGWWCRRYVDDEIQARDIDSPFRVGGAIMGLFDALLTLKEEGKTISKLLLSVEMLAQVPLPPCSSNTDTIHSVDDENV